MARKLKDTKASPKLNSKNDDANPAGLKTKNKVMKTQSRMKDTLPKSAVIEDIAKDIKLDTNVTKLKNIKNKTQKKKVVPNSDEDMQETIPKNNAKTTSAGNKLDNSDEKPVIPVQKGKRKSVTKSAKEPKARKLNVKNENNSNDVSSTVINGGNGDQDSNKIVAKSVRSRKKKVKEEKATVNTILDETDITSVLLKMEGAGPSNSTMVFLDSDTDSGEEDWEEVADYNSPVISQIPTQSVEITIDHPDFLMKKRKKKGFDWKAWVEKKIRRFQKDVRIGIHKVQLLCLLSHGMQQNRICDSPILKGQALSLIPTRILSRNISMVDSAEVKDMITWYKTVVTFNLHPDQRSRSMVTVDQLEEMFEKKEAVTEKQFVLMFLIILRVLGYDVRLVMSFQPMPLKESTNAKNKLKPPRKKLVKKSPNKAKNSDKLKPEQSASKTSNINDNSKKKLKGKSEKTGRKRRASKNVKTYKETESESDSGSNIFIPDEDVSSDESCDNRKSTKGKSPKVKSLKGNNSSSLDEDNSSDFEEEVEFRSPELVRKNKELKKNRKILSSDSSDDSERGCDVWIEVYLQEEQQWICVDCIREVVNKPYDIESAATCPLHYCLAYSNDCSIKDVTPRYASDWLSTTRKLRTDSDWWRETLQTYRSQEEQNEQDDDNIKDQLIKRPLPTSIAQFKNHPLYVLQRHLLKFEAIYPDTAIPVGYIRGVPIYARECVHVLHSRENWMKEGRAVRIGEEPYKMVKSRPKWKKPKENPDALDLEIFGEWQTEIYIPPPAVNGKIPRNEYGNVELFKPWMLPGGTVHLQVPALNRVAKKLGIDCVAAMVGWDYHGGFSHALLEGFVVCEDQKDILMAAWEEDQAIQKQREWEKLEKRVLGNWKLLTRGLLIRERLHTKFDLKKEAEPEKVEEVEEEKEKKKGKKEMAKDAALSWPRRQQTTAQEEKKMNQEHFEVETM